MKRSETLDTSETGSVPLPTDGERHAELPNDEINQHTNMVTL